MVKNYDNSLRYGQGRNFNEPGGEQVARLGLFRRKSEDGGTGENKKLFKCAHCDMVFDDKERMKRHMNKAHREKGGDMPNRNPFGF